MDAIRKVCNLEVCNAIIGEAYQNIEGRENEDRILNYLSFADKNKQNFMRRMGGNFAFNKSLKAGNLSDADKIRVSGEKLAKIINSNDPQKWDDVKFCMDGIKKFFPSEGDRLYNAIIAETYKNIGSDANFEEKRSKLLAYVIDSVADNPNKTLVSESLNKNQYWSSKNKVGALR